MKFFPLVACLFALLMAHTAAAQDAAPSNTDQPIEITAGKAVEWLRNEKKYIARENVVVKQGNVTITSDLLTADYREGAQSGMEIWQLTAEGNVTIADDKNTAYGDVGVYDITTGIATLTGQNLRLVSPDQTVTASEKMEYFSNERKARAVGNAKVVRATDTLSANTMTAFFKDGAQSDAKAGSGNTPLGGGGNLERLEADGNVVIKTPDETLTGNRGIYKAATNTAELIGNVKVMREKNVLEGTRAEVNLTTNVSKMFADESKDGRVRGVFFPGSSKPSDKPKTAPVPAPITPAPQSTTTPEKPLENKAVTPPENTPLAPTPAPARVSPRVDY